MFKNVNSHFSQVPRADIQRSIFDRPKTHKTSGVVGRLYPIYCDIAYPGDTIQMTTSKVIRMQTMLTPIMDNIYADITWWKIPLRLVWDHWKEFMGENSQSAWIPQVTYQVPTISAPSGGFAVGGLADHFELPVGVAWTNAMKNAPMALPFRAYALVCNEWWRDENLTDPLNIPTGDSNQTGTNGDSYINDIANGGMPFKVAKFHDFWTSHLPSSQKGPAVKFPLLSGSQAPVHSGAAINTLPTDTTYPIMFTQGSSVGYTTQGKYISSSGSGSQTTLSNDLSYVNGSVPAHSASDHSFTPVNLWADLSESVGAVTVNQLRLAFQLQRYYEALSRSGSRYTEVIKGLFNIDSPDGRLQRPEYLGGNRIPIQIHEVTNQAQSANDFLGDLGAMSRTSDVHADFITSCSEHCIILGCLCLRYDHSYSQGMNPFWLRKTTTSWYFPQFANVGEMPTPKCCIYADTTTMDSDDVFGYQEAWADLRYAVSNAVTGEMRPGIQNSLASWHLADYYASEPYLSDGWIREDPTNVDRVLAVTSQNADQFFADIYFDSRWTRPLPMFSVPGLIDHH